ncbi:F0F1 ATP synthase subunit A [Georgenia sp. Z1344]|uniref:F0F1 ATP synthase subunit A n=1 Tax=Georgenia sp. Z1344 TaxID=3416706 RepID=UPI003CE83D7F
MTNAATAAHVRIVTAEGGEGWHAPGLTEFFPEPFLFEGTPFAINRIMLVRFIAAIAAVLIIWLGTRKLRLVPGRGQSMMELVQEFVRRNIAFDSLGERLGRKYTPVLTVIFVSVLFFNLTGVIPFLNIAGTSVVGLPLTLAIIAWIAFMYAGIKELGAKKYFGGQLFPAGVPKPIYVILTPIEFISTFLLRPVTLTVRLLANMMSGHILLVLCFSATHYFFFQASGALAAMGGVTLIAGLAFTLFEIFIGALQAYIFTLLAAVYIQLSVADH